MFALTACNALDHADKNTSSSSNTGYVHSDSRMQKKVAAAKRDLAARLNRRQEDIEVLEARYVTWRDASLGCPKPDTTYAQVLTSGARIRLRVDNRIYHYHSSQGEDRAPFLCERPASIDPLPYDFGDA